VAKILKSISAVYLVMHSFKLILCFFFLLIASFVSGQAIDNVTVYKNIDSDHYFRFSYENDYFTATDDLYTQGVNAELVSPSIGKLAVTKILLTPAGSEVKYGLAAEHDAYTPTSIRSDAILYGDRPFCAALFLKFFSIAVDSVNGNRLSSSFSVGVVGTAASGKWMQETIHKALKNNIAPLGWDNQIHNDVVLNYEVEDERQLLSTKALLLSSYGNVRAGTLSDKAGVGFTLMLGRFSSPFQSSASVQRRFRLYFYEQPVVSVIGYDATLQGGMFNHTSPYTISASDIQRITFQDNFGAVITIGNVNLSYYQAYLTKEFKTETYHRWGAISIAVEL
jgi:hypothetical protein